jgi:hypothetical protein
MDINETPTQPEEIPIINKDLIRDKLTSGDTKGLFEALGEEDENV